VLHICALGLAWWHISGALILSGALGSRMVALGRLIGLLVGSAVLLQLALVSRLPWIEPSLGCDRLYVCIDTAVLSSQRCSSVIRCC
jgi:hypothetical protein